jgi:hypothetical protein
MDEQTTSVCLLIINKIPHLPEIALRSILINSTSDIHLGYLCLEDVEGLTSLSTRIKLIDLSGFAEELGVLISPTGYQDYLENDFFKLVQLKWYLFEQVFLVTNSKYVVYSDVDVVWMKEAAIEIARGFDANHNIHLFVQDVSRDVSKTDLCMGFVGIRKGEISSQIILRCKSAHALALKTNTKIGDDSIITDIYHATNSEGFIFPLPQASFPAGYLLNYFRRQSLFVGINREIPYIFHSNYVVGLHKKRLLLFVFLSQFDMHRLYFDRKYRIIANIELSARTIKNRFFA